MADNTEAKAGKPMPKSTIFQKLAETTGLSRKQVSEVFDALEELIKQELGKKGPGVFAIPGLVKLKLVKKPPVKGGEKKINRLTGQEYVTKPKPASVKVKPVALKGLKDIKA
jgi:nucleoid DNA-binding protein